jgi:hypothetical protein
MNLGQQRGNGGIISMDARSRSHKRRSDFFGNYLAGHERFFVFGFLLGLLGGFFFAAILFSL